MITRREIGSEKSYHSDVRIAAAAVSAILIVP
jgi:hypothetical protein